MVASLIGAVIGGATSLLAGRKQARAASSAAALQQRQFQQTRADMAPWREAGANALAELAALYGLSGEDARQAALSRFRTSPGFGFRLAEGRRALDVMQLPVRQQNRPGQPGARLFGQRL